MKKIYFISLLLLAFNFLQAQTWTGTVSTEWNDPLNWTPAGVPGGASNVVIPGSLSSSKWPVFSGNVTINSIDMQPGCRLDVNGYELTINGVNMNINFNGAEINNSFSGSDIVFNINTGMNGFLTYFRSNTINDNIVFNLTGNNQIIEGVAAPANVYNGNAVFNINDVLTTYISYGVASQFNGNLTVNRTVAGVTSLFYAGASITGEFSYVNNAGSATSMGNPGIKTSIGGVVNITANYPSPAPFEIYRLVNQTTGGDINIINSQGFNLQLDTLLVNSLNINGYRGNEYGKLLNNDITGDVTIADDASYTGGFYTYIRNNKITGNSSFSVNGSNTFLEADIAGSKNTYTGDVSFNSAGAALYIGFGDQLQCSGNVAIIRTGTGLTSAFNAGATIGGNFNFNNITAGNTYFGNINNKTSISGTIIIFANYPTPNVFEMYNLVNQTTGGYIQVTGSQGFNFQKDTLLLTDFAVTGYQGSEYGRMLNNDITANVSIYADPGYSNGFATYIRNNIFTGNCSFTSNGSNTFYEADDAGSGNKYYGNLEFNLSGTGDVYISHMDSLWCSGNLSIARHATGNTVAFNAGATIGGNFSSTNSVGMGNTYFGNPNNKTSVGGTVNISAHYSTPYIFEMHHLVNKTNGGIIDIQNSQGFNLQKDTLLLSSMNIAGYSGNEYGRMFNNDITANVSVAADAGYSSGFATYIRNNTFTGNCIFNIYGTNTFYEADITGSGNKYYGNLDVIANGAGDVYIAHFDSLWCSGNLSITRTTPGNTVAFNAGTAINGNFSYTNLTAGNTYLGNINNKTNIGGTVNISAIYQTPNAFVMNRFINHLNGGSIYIQNSLGFNLQYDTLLLVALYITDYRGNEYGKLLNNDITGNIFIADDAAYAGGFFTYLRNNVIRGNSTFSNNGSNTILDADIVGSGNKYLGDLTYTRTAGSIIAAANDHNEISGNLILKSASNISLGKFKFIGNTNGIIEQMISQPINIADLTMLKNTGATISLNDPVFINNTVTFTSGQINSSAGSELIFTDNSTYTGFSDASFVNGPVIKTGNDAFTFPVGKINKTAAINISAPTFVTDEFRAEYFWAIPHNNGYDSTLKDPTIHHVSDNEYWKLDRISGASNVSVTLNWEASRSGVVDYMPDLRVARWNGSLWKDEGNGGTTGNNAAGSVVTAAAVNTFSPFTLASASALNPIPVTLVSFSAAKNNGKVLLQWITENDVSISRYEIERGTDPAVFTTLSGVLSKGSVSQIIYRADDNYPFAGINYYRLKIIGIDGSFSYSNIVKIDTDKKYNISIWPNPARDVITITGADEFMQIQLIDVTGKLVRQMNKAADNQYNIQKLGKGIFYVRLVNASESVTLKLVIE